MSNYVDSDVSWCNVDPSRVWPRKICIRILLSRVTEWQAHTTVSRTMILKSILVLLLLLPPLIESQSSTEKPIVCCYMQGAVSWLEGAMQKYGAPPSHRLAIILHMPGGNISTDCFLWMMHFHCTFSHLMAFDPLSIRLHGHFKATWFIMKSVFIQYVAVVFVTFYTAHYGEEAASTPQLMLSGKLGR